MSRRLLAGAFAATAAIALAGAPAIAAGTTTSSATNASAKAAVPSGSFALSGAEAASFRMPAGMTVLRTWTDADGMTMTRYQQRVGKATVIGGQITTVTDAAGVRVAVIGAHFPDAVGKNAVRLSKAKAEDRAKADLAARGLKGEAAQRA